MSPPTDRVHSAQPALRGQSLGSVCLLMLVLAGPLIACAPALAISTPVLHTTASGAGPIGGPISDQATIAEGSKETGTIEFSLYPPTQSACESEPLYSTADTVAGSGPYTSGSYYPQTVGTYRYLVHYSGDANNAPATTTCGEADEQLVMSDGQPTLATTATVTEARIEDAALLSGGVPTAGSILFSLFGPEDSTCTNTPLFTSTIPVTLGSGRYTSGSYTAVLPGTYRFTAHYGGDANDAPAASGCGAPGEAVTIAFPPPSPPILTSEASAGVTVGEQITDTATITALEAPTGIITFRLFGPSDSSCTGGAIAYTQTVTGNGSYTSPPYTTTAPGTYHYTASYSGDAHNAPATSGCSTVTVTPVPPPTLARSFTVAPVSGTVRVQTAQTAGTSAHTAAIGFVELHSAHSFPIGSIVDTRRGTARVTTATGTPGHTQSGVFDESAFKVRQKHDQAGLTHLQLVDEPNAAKQCTTRRNAITARRHPLPPRVLARLKSETPGHFIINAHYSSASERGTIWEVADQCNGTYTHVSRGVVTVLEYRTHREITLHAHMSYLAPA
jgi:hypothetical protein